MKKHFFGIIGYIFLLIFLSFHYVVCETNQPPIISPIADIKMSSGSRFCVVHFTVRDAETAPNDLKISVTSSNTSIADEQSMVLVGNGENRTLTITPLLHCTGTTLITITVSDNTCDSIETFKLQVIVEGIWKWDNPRLHGNRILGIWGNNPNNIYAVGEFGSIIRYDGIVWKNLTQITSEHLADIVGNQNGNLTIVGASGTIIRFDGTSWSLVEGISDVNLNGIWQALDGKTFVVGDKGSIFINQDDLWEKAVEIPSVSIKSVWGTGSNNVFAVGDAGTILRYDGLSWIPMPLLDNENKNETENKNKNENENKNENGNKINLSLNDVWGFSENDVYSVGDNGVILHYDGSSWSRINLDDSNNFLKIVGKSTSSLFVIGDKGILYRYDGSTWTKESLQYNANCIWNFENTLLAGCDYGKILSYDGQSWLPMTKGDLATIYDMWAGNNKIIAVGSDASILQFNGKEFEPMKHPYASTDLSFNAICGTKNNTLYTVGKNKILTYQDANWQVMKNPISDDDSIELKGIWANDDSYAIAVGSKGTILKYNGVWSSDRTFVNTTIEFTGIWGSDRKNAFAIESKGNIFHYDGMNWQQMQTPVSERLYSIWGTGADNIFIVGSNSTVLHFDGISWSEMSIPENSGTLLKVTGISRNEVYAVGSNGVMLYYNGSIWRELDTYTHNSLYAISKGPNNDIMFCGNFGTRASYTPIYFPEINLITPDNVSESEQAVISKIVLSQAPEKDLKIFLSSTLPEQLNFPEVITIPAFSASASFSISFIDDALFNGTRTVCVAAIALGWEPDIAKIDINDDEKPLISVLPPYRDVTALSGATEFSVENAGTGTMQWEAQSDSGWLRINKGLFGINGGNISVDYDTNFGESRIGVVSVSAYGAANSPQQLKIVQKFSPLTEDKIVPGECTDYDYFGQSLSIFGNNAVIGAYKNDTKGINAGAAYVVQLEGTTWQKEIKISAKDSKNFDYFGYSVAIYGDYLISGAYGADFPRSMSGAAYIFKRQGNDWVQDIRLIPERSCPNMFYGYSVSIFKNFAIVGAYGDDVHGPRSGSAWIYKLGDSGWKFQTALIPDDGSEYDYFGGSVSITDEYAIVGACGDDDNGDMSGSVYIFKRVENKWVKITKLVPNDGHSNDYFGYSVSMSSNDAIVGAFGHDEKWLDSGTVYFYQLNDGKWAMNQKFTDNNGAVYDYLGFSVAMSKSYAIVGAYGDDDDNGYRSGSAYVFQRERNQWRFQRKLRAGDGAMYDDFGYSVAVCDDTIIVGASRSDTNGINAGSVYIYRQDGGPDSQIKTFANAGLKNPKPYSNDVIEPYLIRDSLLNELYQHKVETNAGVEVGFDAGFETNFEAETENGALPITKKSEMPKIKFSYVPTFGDRIKDLVGNISDGNPADWNVMVYIYKEGWKAKPYETNNYTTINSDRTWTCDITTEGNDHEAKTILAFLVPKDYDAKTDLVNCKSCLNMLMIRFPFAIIHR